MLLLAASAAWAADAGRDGGLGDRCMTLRHQWAEGGFGSPALDYPAATPEEITARVNCSLLQASQRWKSKSRSMSADRLQLRDAMHRLAILEAKARNLESVRADALQALTEEQRFADTFFRPSLVVAVASTTVYGPERTQDDIRSELSRRNREAVRQQLVKLRAKPIGSTEQALGATDGGTLEIEPVPTMRLEVFRARHAWLLEVLMLRSPEPLRTSAASIGMGDTVIIGETTEALRREGFAPLWRTHGEEIERIVARVRDLNVFHRSSYEQFLEGIRRTMAGLRKKLEEVESEYSNVSAELNQLVEAVGGPDARMLLLRSLENLNQALAEHHRRAPRMVVEATSNVWQAGSQSEFSREVVDRALRRALERLDATEPVYQAYAWVKESEGSVQLTVLVVAGANVDQEPAELEPSTGGEWPQPARWPTSTRR
jgi:hypothetical protein